MEKTRTDYLKDLVAAGVKFELTNFEDYIRIGDKITSDEEAVNQLDYAKKEVAEEVYDDLNVAMESICEQIRPEIEECSNDEWLGQHYAEGELDRAEKAMATAFPEAVFVAPKIGHLLYHAWNGCRFLHKNGAFGTFCELTAEGKSKFDNI